MAWVVLLIQLLPTIVQVVKLILELIGKLPRPERAGARARLREIAKKHVREVSHLEVNRQPKADMGDNHYTLASGDLTVLGELERYKSELEAKVS